MILSSLIVGLIAVRGGLAPGPDGRWHFPPCQALAEYVRTGVADGETHFTAEQWLATNEPGIVLPIWTEAPFDWASLQNDAISHLAARLRLPWRQDRPSAKLDWMLMPFARAEFALWVGPLLYELVQDGSLQSSSSVIDLDNDGADERVLRSNTIGIWKVVDAIVEGKDWKAVALASIDRRHFVYSLNGTQVNGGSGAAPFLFRGYAYFAYAHDGPDKTLWLDIGVGGSDHDLFEIRSPVCEIHIDEGRATP